MDEEFRYLQRKKNVVKELAEVRLKVSLHWWVCDQAYEDPLDGAQNITFLSNLTKFRVVPPHLILHMFKVCLDDFSGTNVDNIALLLEGCGRFLLRDDETKQRFGTMVSPLRCIFGSLMFTVLSVGAHEAKAKLTTFRSKTAARPRERILSGRDCSKLFANTTNLYHLG